MPMRVNKWTPERLKQLVSLLQETRSIKAAAEAMGETEASVRSTIHQNKIEYQQWCLPPATARQPWPATPAAPVDSSKPLWQSYRPSGSFKAPEKGKPAKATREETETRIVVPDVHRPAHDKAAWDVFLGVLRDLKPQRGVIIGDFGDVESLSQHPRSRPDLARFAGEVYDMNIGLDEMQNASPSTDWVYIEGNHESRASRWEAAYPQLAEALSLPRALYIEAGEEYHRNSVQLRGMRWVPLRAQPFHLGPVMYLHGVYETKHHAMAHAENLGPEQGKRSSTYGHMHTFQAFRSPAGYEAQCCGFLGDRSLPQFSYRKGRPSPWVSGFLIEEVCGDHVTKTPVHVEGARALFGGKLYGRAA